MNSLMSALKAAFGKVFPAPLRTEERQINWSPKHASDAAGAVIFIEISYGEHTLRPVRIAYKKGFGDGSALEGMAQDICHVASVLLSQESIELGAIEGLLVNEQSLHRGRADFGVLAALFTTELLKPSMFNASMAAKGEGIER